jgi:hypothetical protein
LPIFFCQETPKNTRSSSEEKNRALRVLFLNSPCLYKDLQRNAQRPKNHPKKNEGKKTQSALAALVVVLPPPPTSALVVVLFWVLGICGLSARPSALGSATASASASASAAFPFFLWLGSPRYHSSRCPFFWRLTWRGGFPTCFFARPAPRTPNLICGRASRLQKIPTPEGNVLATSAPVRQWSYESHAALALPKRRRH